MPHGLKYATNHDATLTATPNGEVAPDRWVVFLYGLTLKKEHEVLHRFYKSGKNVMLFTSYLRRRYY